MESVCKLEERHRCSSMQNTYLLATLSQKTPLANNKQRKSLQDGKMRICKLHPSKGKGQLKRATKRKASLKALSFIF